MEDTTLATRSDDRRQEVAVVWIEPPPSSVPKSGWAQPFRHRLLWEHCADQLRHKLSLPLVVLGPAGSDVLRDRCVALGLRYFQGTSLRQLQCVIELANEIDVSGVLVLHALLGLGLAPWNLTEQVIQLHRQTGADVTLVTGMPSPLSAVMLDRRFLDLLQELPAGIWLEEEPARIAEMIERSMGEPPPREGLHVTRLPFSTATGLSAGDFPSYIPWTYQGDIERLETVLQQHPEGDARAMLPELRRVIIEDLERAHRRRYRTGRKTGLKRVLFASNPSAYTGAEACLVNTIRALRPGGFDLHCLVAQEGLFASLARDAGATVHILGRDGSATRVDTLLMVDELIEFIRPDLIHCNAAVGFPLLAISRLRGIPLVQWVRTAAPIALLDHLVCADMITAVSSFVAGETIKQMIHPEKVRVLYDCVDTERFSPEGRPSRDVRAELNIGPDEFVILCIARFARNKRHDVLLNATAITAERHSNIRLILIGDPLLKAETYPDVLSLINDLHLSRRTIVADFQCDVLSYEFAADAVVLCSEQEALGTVVLESMALGKPVIVASSGGLVEMIENGISGLHCVPGDPHSLSEQMCRLIESPAERKRLGEGARKAASERFSLSAHAERLLSFYSELSNSLC